MKDNNIDALIQKKINNESKALPPYLAETKKITLGNLPTRNRSQVLARKYGSIAIISFFCIALMLAVESQLFYRLFNNKYTIASNLDTPIKSKVVPLVKRNVKTPITPPREALIEIHNKSYIPITNKTKTAPSKQPEKPPSKPIVAPPSNDYAVTDLEKKQLSDQGFIVENIYNSLEKVTGLEVPAPVLYDNTQYPNTVEELAATAKIIIQGQVIGVKYFEYRNPADNSNLPKIYTLSKVKVLKSYNSQVKAGDVLSFIEKGGVSSRYDYWVRNNMLDKLNGPQDEIEKAKKELVMELGDFDAPVMDPSDKVFIFGESTKEQYGLSEKLYAAQNNFWGKFNINNETLSRFVPSGWESLCDPLKMTISEMETKLQQYFSEQK